MQVSVTLEDTHWAAVINLLAEHPYKQVAPLIMTIQRQIIPPPPSIQAPANGADAEAAAA